MVFRSLDPRPDAKKGIPQEERLSVASAESVLRRAVAGGQRGVVAGSRPQFHPRELIRAYGADDRLPGAPLGPREVAWTVRKRHGAHRPAVSRIGCGATRRRPASCGGERARRIVRVWPPDRAGLLAGCSKDS